MECADILRYTEDLADDDDDDDELPIVTFFSVIILVNPTGFFEMNSLLLAIRFINKCRHDIAKSPQDEYMLHI